MSSCCENSFLVEGRREEVLRFARENSVEGQLRFALSLPPPSGQTAAWNERNWGVSREVNDSALEVFENKAVSRFETVATPPRYWFMFLVRKYSRLHLEIAYRDRTHNYSGFVAAKKGQVFTHAQGAYDAYSLHDHHWASLC